MIETAPDHKAGGFQVPVLSQYVSDHSSILILILLVFFSQIPGGTSQSSAEAQKQQRYDNKNDQKTKEKGHRPYPSFFVCNTLFVPIRCFHPVNNWWQAFCQGFFIP